MSTCGTSFSCYFVVAGCVRGCVAGQDSCGPSCLSAYSFTLNLCSLLLLLPLCALLSSHTCNAYAGRLR